MVLGRAPGRDKVTAHALGRSRVVDTSLSVRVFSKCLQPTHMPGTCDGQIGASGHEDKSAFMSVSFLAVLSSTP